ncbi:hypothetical protein [Halosegnis marinus]|uniref:hypothetical protein n=1 Tax=Halosegnis marinus TaxID=3034023 RepID=UPI003620C5CF
MRTLAERVRAGEAGDTARYSLLTFLAATGAEFERVAEHLGDASADLRYQYERLANDGAQFAPPSCATMKANGDCHDPDDLCEEITQPLGYYEERLDTVAADD